MHGCRQAVTHVFVLHPAAIRQFCAHGFHRPSGSDGKLISNRRDAAPMLAHLKTQGDEANEWSSGNHYSTSYIGLSVVPMWKVK